ncbi:SDR family oxidoreductase [Cellulomonas endophytica]|uniref:SDR family oxidoreductase n=1 Tax=Cellulomonas endophytica TaxID=2494735 RepID=UPI0010118AB7|nr:SDR family oxidoreductase [Cellulomonas endophytica]
MTTGSTGSTDGTTGTTGTGGDALESLVAPPGPRGVAVVTGGSAGLGRAIVRRLAQDGWDVAVLARGRDGLSGAVADVAALGRRALAVPTDVADHAQVERAAAAVEDRLGPVDLWVNNAMTGVFGTFLEVEPEDYERATSVTYLGFVNGTRSALRRMVPRDRGTVVQVGSSLAYRGIPAQSAYCGAKHAMVGMTESVVAELLGAGSHVRVCMVHMPALNTPQFDWLKNLLPDRAQPVPPIYQPEVGAEAVAHVARHPRRSMWVGTSTAYTILGNRFAAPLLDRYLARNGISGQQVPGEAKPDLGPNLYASVPGDRGAHGAFDDRARDRSLQVWADRNRGVLAGAAAAAGTATALAVGLLRRR